MNTIDDAIVIFVIFKFWEQHLRHACICLLIIDRISMFVSLWNNLNRNKLNWAEWIPNEMALDGFSFLSLYLSIFERLSVAIFHVSTQWLNSFDRCRCCFFSEFFFLETRKILFIAFTNSVFSFAHSLLRINVPIEWYFFRWFPEKKTAERKLMFCSTNSKK